MLQREMYGNAVDVSFEVSSDSNVVKLIKSASNDSLFPFADNNEDIFDFLHGYCSNVRIPYDAFLQIT